ncbi:MAG: hypothetical protein JWN30_797 [Bacilli bacterium]|nr:hypothetical protein [Bacilli bacterium]
MWRILNQHKSDDGESVAIDLEDPDGSFEAHVRWDGCMQIDMTKKTEENVVLEDTIHTCDLDDLIRRLQELKQISQEFFDYTGAWQPDREEDPYL